VRSSSIWTRAGSIATRAACRYSSSRCAEGRATAPTTSVSVKITRMLFRGELRTVVVRGIAIDGVDVIDAALLGCVFDHQRRSLDTEVSRAAVGRRPAPGEIG